jgi:hypothetical protein
MYSVYRKCINMNLEQKRPGEGYQIRNPRKKDPKISNQKTQKEENGEQIFKPTMRIMSTRLERK